MSRGGGSSSGGGGGGGRVRKILEAPIDHLFQWKREAVPVEIWLFEQRDIRLHGFLLGFDQFMNLVLDSVIEVSRKHQTSKPLGRMLLKGENVTLIRPAPYPTVAAPSQPEASLS
jgi:small nuclear ribonucleoprotein E